MEFKEKEVYSDGKESLRIMAIKEKYIMARFKRCIPFVKHETDFQALIISQKLVKTK